MMQEGQKRIIYDQPASSNRKQMAALVAIELKAFGIASMKSFTHINSNICKCFSSSWISMKVNHDI